MDREIYEDTVHDAEAQDDEIEAERGFFSNPDAWVPDDHTPG